MKRRKLNIVDGPSKWDLMLVLFDPEISGEEPGLRTVVFTVSHDTFEGFTSDFKQEIQVRVFGVEHAFIPHEGIFQIKIVNARKNEYADVNDCFEGLYSTGSRKGELEPFDPQ